MAESCMIKEMSVPPGLQERRQKNLVLIMAREFASKLATATFITDADGDLVFYNEPAEEILGRRFAEAGELKAEEWSALWKLQDLEGKPMPLERTPGGIALLERRPVHRDLCLTGLDGVVHQISATAFPLMATPDELVGMVAIFWKRQSG
jgi:PAS domain-containing protein